MFVKFRKVDVYFSFLCDFNNGSIVYNYKLFFVNFRSLKILFYFYDIEINNQQIRRKDKLVVFYFQLGNLYFKYKLKLKFMNFLVFVENFYLKKYGIDVI